jgi:hypothetical protein
LSPSSQAHPLELNDHDHIFWAGDLNYRISMPDLDAVYAKIEAQDWPALLAHDQARTARVQMRWRGRQFNQSQTAAN